VNGDSDARTPAHEQRGGLLRHLFERIESGGVKGTLNLEDIQGLILRGYRMPMVRHFLLTVSVAAKARELLGRLVSGDETDTPQITTAKD
jgi:hypothetical protein